MNKPDMGNKMRAYLLDKLPLTVLTLARLYADLAEQESDKPQVRYQLYRHSLGNKAALHSPPRHYYAIQLRIPDDAGRTWKAFLTLPVIERDAFIRDAADDEVDEIISELKAAYGEQTIDYWGRAAQYRSVDFIHGQVKEAKARSGGKCQICSAMLEQGYVIESPHRGFHAAHIISRRTVFWRSAADLHRRGLNLFSDEGVEALCEAIAGNNLHSSSDYILGLCRQHDRHIQRTIARAVGELKARERVVDH